jgi:hypothetical protein
MITLHGPIPGTTASTIVVLLAAGLAAAAQPTTDNAALLYYQACLLYGPPDGTLEQTFTDFREGKIPSTEEIRKHLEASRFVIGYVVKAADLPQCDWGYDYSLGLDLTLTHLSAIKRIAFLIQADARLFAEQGDYRTALDRCMTIYKMGRHVTDGTLVTYLVGMAMSALANKTVQDLQPGVSAEPQSLDQLATQLRQVQEAFPSMQRAFTQEAQVLSASMSKARADDFIRTLGLNDEDPNTRLATARILGGDEAFFERNRAHWFDTVAALVATLDRKLPYAQTQAELARDSARVAAEWKDNPDATLTELLWPAASRVHALATRLQGHFHALRAATELYAIRARTGQLPRVLPADAPGDPFGGEAFVYEIAKDHFTLRCREKEGPEKAAANQYEFKLRQ